MPIPNVIGDLSTTASSNGPAGSETPTDGDGYLRAHAGFIAELRDKLDGTSGTITVRSGTFSGTMAGAASWSGLQTFAGGIAGTGIATVVSAAKSATTSRSSTTSVADDPHLVVALTDGTWAITLMVPIWATTGGAGGYKACIAFSGTSSTAAIGFGGLTNGIVLPAYTTALSGTISETTIDVQNGVTSAAWLTVHGTITVTAAGNLTFKWAQNSSSINALNVGIGGWLSCTKVA